MQNPRRPMALTGTWASETPYWRLVKRAHICKETNLFIKEINQRQKRLHFSPLIQYLSMCCILIHNSGIMDNFSLSLLFSWPSPHPPPPPPPASFTLKSYINKLIYTTFYQLRSSEPTGFLSVTLFSSNLLTIFIQFYISCKK